MSTVLISPSIDLGIPADLWTLLIGTRTNALIVGSDEATADVCDAMTRTEHDSVWCSDGTRLSVSPSPVSTLIVRRVDQLAEQGQEQLSAWLARHDDARVIATSLRPLYPQLARGAFLEPLYYQLNTLLVHCAR